ncbi:MAG: orotidine-5'-phosphate decarboxylase [Methylocystis sp.]|nr:orotidine-5'-phosphate decarboxylase [Methylocystis sp.]
MAAAAPLRRPESDFLEQARGKLIVALDFDALDEAERCVDVLGDDVTFYKIGLCLQLAGGDQFAKDLLKKRKRVFLDYKYFDIEETMRTAVARAAQLGVSFLTVHGAGGILRGAVAGRGDSSLKILCVTVLTSMDAADIKEMGFDCDVEQLVISRAVKALKAGCDGVIASASEAPAIRQQTSGKLVIVTPGVRPEGSAADDQKRTATPDEAIRAGADYLVVGRPITRAADPKAAARAIIEQMAAALRAR